MSERKGGPGRVQVGTVVASTDPALDRLIELEQRADGGMDVTFRRGRRHEGALDPGRPRRGRVIPEAPTAGSVRPRRAGSRRRMRPAGRLSAGDSARSSSAAWASASIVSSRCRSGRRGSDHRTRTVTPPRPNTSAVRASRSRTSAVWLSTPRTKTSARQRPFEHPQPSLAHVAEPGVVVAALGVVVVRDDRGPQTGRLAEQVEAVQPGRIRPDLVDLVDRDRRHAEGQRGGARHRDDAAVGQLPGEAAGIGPPAHWVRA